MKKTLRQLIIFSIIAITFVAIAEAGRIKVIRVAVVKVSDSVDLAFRKSRDHWDSTIDRFVDIAAGKRDDTGRDAIKGYIRYTSTTSVAASMSSIPFEVRTIPENANVRIMNIQDKYRDGIRLKPGRYDIEVTSPGYRMRRFWIDVGPHKRSIEIRLNKKGGLDCSPTLEISGGSLANYGTRIRAEDTFHGVTLDEIFFAYAAHSDKMNTTIALDSGITEKYAYIDMIQPTNLSWDQIKDNNFVEIDPDRHGKLFMGFEKIDNDTVKVISYAEFPQHTVLRGTADGALKEAFCLGWTEL